MTTPKTLLRPFQTFFRLEAAGGILLLVCAALALVWANSPWAEAYRAVFDATVTVGIGAAAISKPLLLWINDGLMAIFFFVVGLEIKREVLVGELAQPKKAALALAGAAGGMVVPALIYAVMNVGGPGSSGWGIPMATDIAFALGVLALLGKRAPLALKVFLTALAIVDDLGAVLVIAFFYTEQIALGALGIAALFLVALMAVNRFGVRRTSVYVVLGLGLWVAFLKSGVHATIAGVLLALTIPANRLIDAPTLAERVRSVLDMFAGHEPGRHKVTTDQQDALHTIEHTLHKADAPLLRMEHALHGWVAFGIMPLFALANAGVTFGGAMGDVLTNPITLGIVLGLVVGKQIGVTAFAWLAVRLGWAALPAGISWRQIHGVSALCGIGFTMSLFIANLAFADALLLDSAKVGILAASVVSGLIGWFLLTRPGKPAATEPAPAPRTAQEPQTVSA